MAFEALVKHARGGEPLVGVSISYAKALRISLGRDVVEKLKWKPKDCVSILLGNGEDDGKVRVVKSPKGFSVIAVKKSSNLCLQVKLPVPPACKQPPCAAVFTFIEGGIEARLPKWSPPPAAAETAERPDAAGATSPMRQPATPVRDGEQIAPPSRDRRMGTR